MLDNCLAALFDIGIRVGNTPAAHFQFYLYYAAAPVAISYLVGIKFIGEQFSEFRPFDVVAHSERVDPHTYAGE